MSFPSYPSSSRIPPIRGRLLHFSLFANVLLLLLLLHAFSNGPPAAPAAVTSFLYANDREPLSPPHEPPLLLPNPDAFQVDRSPKHGVVHFNDPHHDSSPFHAIEAPPLAPMLAVAPAEAGEIAINDGKGRRLTRNCRVCRAGDTFCEELGEHNIARSVLYEGTNIRLRRLLAKLRRGEPIVVAVVGGSVSAGQGLNFDNNAIVHKLIFDHINETFPHPDHSFVNGAVPARGSTYFQHCFQEHIPEEADLVLVELGINDQAQTASFDSFELLVRGLLELPNSPAVISLQVFGLAYSALSTGGDQHYGVASFYDIPTISLRNVLLPQILQDAERRKFFYSPNARDPGGYDVSHIGRNGHAAMANLVNLFIDRQICEMDRIESEGKAEQKVGEWQWMREENIEVMPRLRLTNAFSLDGVVPKMHSTCSSTTSKKHPLEIYKTDGWSFWRDDFKKKPYIMSNTTGSTVSFKFKTTLGRMQLSYLRSATFGLGIIDCWVDDNTNQIRSFSGYTTEKINVPHTSDISHALTPGEHTLNCLLTDRTDDPTGGHEFRITAIMGI